MTSQASYSLTDLQEGVRCLLEELNHPRVGAALALSEECGEVCDLVLKRECYGQELAEGDLAGELADVLVCVAELANLYGIDLGEACPAKLKDLQGRVPQWRRDFGEGLASARERMD